MPNDQDQWLFVGCFLQEAGAGLRTMGFDASNAKRSPQAPVADAPQKCIFVRPDPDRRHLLACEVTDQCEGVPGGALHCYGLDRSNRTLKKINHRPTQGHTPCYVDVHRSGRWAVVGHHGDGSICVLPINDQGELEAASHVVKHQAPKPEQQPRVHCCLFDPSHQYVLVADRGIDQVVVYRFDEREGMLIHHHTRSTDEGEDPRHLAFSPNGQYLYCITEVGNHVLTMAWDGQRGELEPLQSVSTLPDDYDEQTFAADLHVHPSGRFVYGSNRGHESIAMFAVEDEGAALRPLGHEPTRGIFPRGFTIDTSGQWLIVGNEKSDRIDLFQIDPSTGTLTHAGEHTDIPRPAGLHII